MMPVGSDAASSAHAKLESERHAVTMELAEVRRKSQGAAALVRNRAADASVFMREICVLGSKSQEVARLLSGSHSKEDVGDRRLLTGRIATLQPRLSLEEAAEAALRMSEARIASELAELRRGDKPLGTGRIDVRLRSAASAKLAQQCADSWAAELKGVRVELSHSSAAIGRGAPPDPPKAPWADLEAAGLQRQVGLALAAEREHRCKLHEEVLQERLNAEANQSLQDHISQYETTDRPTEQELGPHNGDLQRCVAALWQAQETLEALSQQRLAGRFTPSGPEMPVGSNGVHRTPIREGSAAEAVAAADLTAAPSVAAARFHERLAALRGGRGSGGAAAEAGAEVCGNAVATAPAAGGSAWDLQ